MRDQLLLLATIASNIALDLLLWAMHSVSYQRIAMAIDMTSEYGAFIFVVFL